MPTTHSPLRYPGGKSQLSSFVTELIEQNELTGGTYVEPFAGGAGIAWHLLQHHTIEQVVINDLAPSLHAFWDAVLFQTDALCTLIEDTPVTIEEWLHQKELQKQKSSGLALAFSTLFLNRTNRSGIIKAGVIGGKAQAGGYKLDCRYNKADLIKKIAFIGSNADRITLTQLDGKQFLDTITPTLEEKSLINIDPPYYNKGKALYQNFFEPDDHQALFESVLRLNHPWMVTYDNTPEIRSIYHYCRPLEFQLNYSAQIKRKGSELIIISPELSNSSCLRQLTA